MQIGLTEAVALLAAMGGLIAWFMRLESRLNNSMSRKEHEGICEKKHIELKDAMKDIQESVNALRGSIEAKESYSSQQRHAMRDQLQKMEIQLVKVAMKVGVDLGAPRA